MSNKSIARVHYFERQFLRTPDFTDEQSYHLDLRRRHNIAHHTWGIVHGLELMVEDNGIFVNHGMAVDGFGRELILTQKQNISTAAFAEKNSDRLAVWLVYDRIGADTAPEGYSGCGETSNVAFYRWQEQPRIYIDVPDPAFTDPRKPKGVPAGDLEFNASQVPPDDPQEYWPVFLGQIIQDLSNSAQPYSVELANRPYAGLKGEALTAPSGRVHVQIGAENEDDDRRFAVFVPEAQPGAEPVPPQLEIDKNGQIDIRGHTTLHGNLKMAKGAIEFRAGAARQPDAPPWRIYHLENDNGNEHKLYIEMDKHDQGGMPGLNQVVIGFWFAEEGQEAAFKPCLTIRDDRTVVVHGNLVVEGKITGKENGPVKKASKRVSSEAMRLIQAGFLSGIGGANILLAPALRGFLLAQAGEMTTTALKTAPEVTMRAIAEYLAEHTQLMQDFADLMTTERPGLAEDLREALKA
jgi:hypothetical protein